MKNFISKFYLLCSLKEIYVQLSHLFIKLNLYKTSILFICIMIYAFISNDNDHFVTTEIEEM